MQESYSTAVIEDPGSYIDGLTASKQLYERARKVEPAGVQGDGRFYSPRPVFISRAKAARLWDVDGNEYIDLHGSYGPSLLGYNDDRVAAAVKRVLDEEGVLFALPHPREVELAETLVRLIPSAEMAIFTAEGTTAVYHAVRVARAYSGKTGVLKFEGAYHGWTDDVNASVSPPPAEAGPAERPTTQGWSAGAVTEVKDLIHVAPWNDLASTQAIARENKDKIGVIIVEPVMRYIRAAPGFLEAIRALADEIGAVLIFDEIITGFRSGLGGAQTALGVTPDLTVLGKAIANGFTLAATVGKREIMELFGPGGPVFFSGTFNGHLLSVAAGQETLRILEEERVPETVAARTEDFRRYLANGITELGVPASVMNWYSTWYLFFRPTLPQSYRDVIDIAHNKKDELMLSYVHFMLANGVYAQPFYLIRARFSYAHTESDMNRVADLTLEWLKRNARQVEAAAALNGVR
jgi:glutamate-1-semialdehyde 2,1-aminomutase